MPSEEALLRAFFSNPIEVIESVFTIPNIYGDIIPFRPTPIQKDYLSHRTGRDLSLKPRQVYVSSAILASNTVLLATRQNINALITTDSNDVTQKFRERLKHHFQNLRDIGLPITYDIDNESQLHIKETGNSIFFTEAGSTGVGRGMPFSIVHMSEVAFWKTITTTPGQAIAGIMRSVPAEHSQVDMESTPFGSAGAFYEHVLSAKKGQGSFKLHFWPWWWEERYKSLIRAEPPYSAIELALMETYALTPYQIQWRRHQIEEMAPTGVPFEQEYPEDPDTCFLAGESSYLTADIVLRLRSRVLSPIQSIGDFVRVYKKPQPGRVYVAGIDAAEGIVTSPTADSHALQILDLQTMEQVCVIHGLLPIDEFADLCNSYLRQYNECLVGVEVPGPGVAIIERLEAQRYPNLYWHQSGGPDSDVWRPGWPATATSNTISLSELYTALDGGFLILYDAETISQLAGMQWHRPKIRRANRFARAEAASGGHDDLVFALRIAHQIAPFAADKRGMVSQERVYNGSGLV